MCPAPSSTQPAPAPSRSYKDAAGVEGSAACACPRGRLGDRLLPCSCCLPRNGVTFLVTERRLAAEPSAGEGAQMLQRVQGGRATQPRVARVWPQRGLAEERERDKSNPRTAGLGTGLCLAMLRL